mmetsp:Transcript_9358/g.22443  ORF Transcript_9358/g.22443 Transcript_9358/m.22443 type:complete len:547 (+) Transcript_9358:72-1712(+)
MEVSIQLKSGANLSGHSQDDILRAVQDEYFNRYLDKLGIAPTSANKAQMMKFRPMDDLEVTGIWADDTSSGLASAIRIAPPLRHRLGYQDGDEEPLDRAIISHLYGEADDIPVEPPNVPERTIIPLDEAAIDRMFPDDKTRQLPCGQTAPQTLSIVRKNRAEWEEKQRRRQLAASGAHAAGLGGRPDVDQQQRFKQELEMLKMKYILPFACDRPLQEGSRRTQVVPWAPHGPLDMKLPSDLVDQVSEPLSIEIEQIQVQMKSWVQNQLPLELLSSAGRTEPQFLEELRGALWETQVCQLIGLLGHLLYWLAFSCCRRPEQPRLSQYALQGLVTAAHESWVKLERRHKNSKLGISLAMPCVLLTLKYGMEVCFESQYPSLFGEKSGEWIMRQDLIERINTLLMRLFDPDGTYARFGRLDAMDHSFTLYRKIELLESASSPNRSRPKQLQGRVHRATPLVRAALQAGQNGAGGIGTEHPKTRALLVNSEQGGSASLASVVAPPSDEHFREKLLRAANSRLGALEKVPPLQQVELPGVRRRGTGAQSAR